MPIERTEKQGDGGGEPSRVEARPASEAVSAEHGLLPRSRISVKSHQLSKTHRQPKRPAFDRVVLLLQGGGALGAYQAGVYEALAEANLHPDWVAARLIKGAKEIYYPGAPHGLTATHQDKVNADLLAFIKS